MAEIGTDASRLRLEPGKGGAFRSGPQKFLKHYKVTKQERISEWHSKVSDGQSGEWGLFYAMCEVSMGDPYPASSCPVVELSRSLFDTTRFLRKIVPVDDTFAGPQECVLEMDRTSGLANKMLHGCCQFYAP